MKKTNYTNIQNIGKNKEGISLIMLVITIIVILVLSGAVILSIINSSIIPNAEQAKVKSNIDSIQSKYDLWASKSMTDSPDSISGTGVLTIDANIVTGNFTTTSLTKNTTLSSIPTLADLGLGSDVSSAIVNNNNVIAISMYSGTSVKYYKKVGNDLTEITKADYLILAVRNTNYTKWDGTYATGYDSGSGSQSDPYHIKTAAQLAYLAQQCNNIDNYASGLYFVLDNNIDLGGTTSWPTIGAGGPTGTTRIFGGVFDGQNNTVLGMYYNGSEVNTRFGLFKNANGTIKNLKLDNSYVCNSNSTASTAIGGIVGNLTAGGVIDNCYSHVTVIGISPNSTYAAVAGGVVGVATSSTISNCISEGTTKGSGLYCWIGGIIGRNQGSTIVNCTNLGTVVGDPTNISSCYLGGIVGYSGAYTSLVTNCINYGELIASSTSVGTGLAQIGGICGYNYTSSIFSSVASTIENCKNYGKITVNLYSKSIYFGGIVGCNKSILNTANSSTTGCMNYADILVISNSTDAGAQLVGGGVAGVTGANTGTVVTINNNVVTNSGNFGKISVTAPNVPVNLIGGVAGWNSLGKVAYCYNNGATTINVLNNALAAGGVLGQNQETGTLSYSYNNGKVDVGTNSSTYVGGVIGQMTANASATKNYYLSSAYAGGISKADVTGQAEGVTNNILTFEEFMNWIITK